MSLKQKVTEFYDKILVDPQAAIAEYLSADVEWVNPMPEPVASFFGGSYKGHDGVMQYLVQIVESIELSPLHWIDVTEEGNIVTCIGDEVGTTVLSTGKKYDMPCVHVLRFDDSGKINHVREYNDTTQMLAAFS